jgi:divalent metal cation (Fe/Co/Zn/Cd) transporter
MECIAKAVAAADEARMWRSASSLAFFTIFYNIAEGIVSVGFGASDDTLSLFGFGVDSFVEVISGIGIWHMIRRIRMSGAQERDGFERKALRVTGFSFYLLAAGLCVAGAVSAVQGRAPVTTSWGIAVSVVSIVAMLMLVRAKEKVGRKLASEAILADAACTRTCLRLSVVLLAASVGFEITGIGLFDVAGSFGIAWLAWKEGREAIGKAEGKSCCCGGSCR